jgi:transcription-repair coupling factor (superfamily II helicase)
VLGEADVEKIINHFGPPAHKVSLENIIPLIRETEAVQSLLSRLRSGERDVSLSGVAGSLASYLTAAVKEAFPQEPLLLVAPDEESGQNTKEDLEGLLGRGSVFWFPESDALEGQRWPTDEVAGDRLAALAGLASGETGCVVVTTQAAMLQPTAGREWLQASITTLKAGETLDLEELVERLVASGYEHLSLVSDLGEVSVRGGIVDAFPHGKENPVRIEFLGDEVVSLREFDPITQRSVASLAEVTLLPRWEAPSEETLLGHLPSGAIVWLDERQGAGGRNEGPAPPGPEYGTKQVIRLTGLGDVEIRDAISFGSRRQEQLDGALNLLRRELAALDEENYRAFILCENEGQRERLEEILQGVERAGTVEPDVSPPGPHASLLVGTLTQGFIFPQARVAAFTDHEIFGRQRFRRRYRRFARGTPIRDYLSLTPGDYVVHIRFGIGRYQGLTRLAVDGKERDCLQVVYRDGDKLYVPLEEMKQVERYLAKEGHVPVLSKLGGTAWEQVKSRARKAVQAMAKELLALYASRQAMQGFKYSSDTPWQKALESSFPYEETEDQLESTGAIKADMESERPMDRLLCGDVGFGKTEVAIRAAFKAVMDGKQVAILVPTTVLAEQHFHTFRERFKEFPVRVEMLSRFREPRAQKQVAKALEAGQVDVVIGTHRLLSRDIRFKDLGLLVVDEEQRFGVLHKERLKGLTLKEGNWSAGTPVDVLTMTATPIPRTLNFSLAGARDLSIIEDPPRDRLSVVTRVAPWDERLIVEAVLKEADRGGQVFFLHNRVESIEAMRAYLARILPGIRIAVAHGQMEERTLEKTMLDFVNRRHDLLLATTIIESGLDMPNVNTMVVNRADKFGLAQLYQLRGRVGRSSRRAYCYLLIPAGGKVTAEARKRLAVIEELSELGSGFRLALRDLEFRGAGNLLGAQQHGHMLAVGFDLYCKLLEETVRETKGLPPREEALEPAVQVDWDAFLAEDYVPDSEERVALYRRLAAMRSLAELDELRAELVDRFGPVPEAGVSLLSIVELRLLGQAAGVEKISLRGNGLSLIFRDGLTRDQAKLIVERVKQPLEFVSTAKESGVRVKLASGREAEGAKEILTFLSHP